MTSRRGRKREPDMHLYELLWALEDDVGDRRRSRSEPPVRARRLIEPKFQETQMEFNLERAFEEVMGSSSAEVTLPEQSEVSQSKRSKKNKRRKMKDAEKSDETPKEDTTEEEKPEITVLVEDEAPSLFMTPPKSPDHEQNQIDSKQRLLDCVNEYRAQGDNRSAITLLSQLAQMAYCYNHKERPGENKQDYDNMEELMNFYQDAPQISDPPGSSDDPSYFMPQKLFLMRRQTRERLYGAVSLLRSQQVYSRPQIPDHLKHNAMVQAMAREAAAMGRNCHTVALLLEDLHSIPDL